MTNTLQPLLPKDKQNPYLSIYKSEKEPDKLEVYFELALLEKVNNGINSYHGKHLLARLYNANFKRKSLVETFGISISTLHRWGDALLTGDELIIHKAFSGQGSEKRITQDIERFIISKFNEIYESQKYKYSSIILSDIEEIFQEKLTSEAIRPIINIQKKKFDNISDTFKTINTSINCEEHKKDENFIEIKEILEVAKSEEIISQKSIIKANSCDSSNNLPSKKQNNRKLSLSSQNDGGIRIHHIGVLLAFYLINELKFEEKIVYQWLASILAGAVNIEQTASLDFESLQYLLNQECITSKNINRQH